MFFDMNFSITNGRASFKKLVKHLYEINWYYGVYEIGKCVWWIDAPFFDSSSDLSSFQENRLFSPEESLRKADDAILHMKPWFSPIIPLSKLANGCVICGRLAYYEPSEDGVSANICFAVNDNSRCRQKVWDRNVEEAFRHICSSGEVECGIGGFELDEDDMSNERLVKTLNLQPNVLPPLLCGPEKVVSPLLSNISETHHIYHIANLIVGVSNKSIGRL